MNKAELIKGLDLAIESMTIIKNALSDSGGSTSSPARANDPDFMPTAAELKSMPYNEFKQFAASLGVKCTGTRDEIMTRVLEVYTPADSDAEKPAPDPTADVKQPKKLGKKSADPASAADDGEEESDKSSKGNKLSGGKSGLVRKAGKNTGDAYDEQAKEIMEDTPFDDIAASLKDAGVKGVTKKNVSEKLAAALREGLIELDDEDGEDPDEGEESTSGGEFNANSYFSDFDPEGYNDPETMSKERAAAIEEKVGEIIDSYNDESLSIEDVQTYLESHATQDELDALGDDPHDGAMLALYIELTKRHIDNDGEFHDGGEDPYEVGEHDFCCGHPLKYVKKTKRYVCEHCGSEYEAD